MSNVRGDCCGRFGPGVWLAVAAVIVVVTACSTDDAGPCPKYTVYDASTMEYPTECDHSVAGLEPFCENHTYADDFTDYQYLSCWWEPNECSRCVEYPPEEGGDGGVCWRDVTCMSELCLDECLCALRDVFCDCAKDEIQPYLDCVGGDWKDCIEAIVRPSCMHELTFVGPTYR
jgi:hypothetical protein